MYTMINRTWTVFISSSSAKIILKPLGLPGPIKLPLQLYFFLETLMCVKRHHRVEEVAPITEPKFKAFPQKNLCKSKLFVESIWKKIKRNSRYQLEEVYDWVFHLKYLQSILIEFDSTVAPTKFIMVRYFKKGLKSSIKAEIDQNAI